MKLKLELFYPGSTEPDQTLTFYDYNDTAPLSQIIDLGKVYTGVPIDYLDYITIKGTVIDSIDQNPFNNEHIGKIKFRQLELGDTLTDCGAVLLPTFIAEGDFLWSTGETEPRYFCPRKRAGIGYN